jgi:hypothetical protein
MKRVAIVEGCTIFHPTIGTTTLGVFSDGHPLARVCFHEREIFLLLLPQEFGSPVLYPPRKGVFCDFSLNHSSSLKLYLSA